MRSASLPASLAGLRIHLVGAKGTGMAAFAEILASEGAALSGSDVAETFYTDAILSRLGIPVAAGFDASNIASDVRFVLHSAAYRRDSNPDLVEAERRGIPILSFPEALGDYSRTRDSSGIAGVHGKTTTTALAGAIIAALDLPATILAGSAVSSFGGRSTLINGDGFFVAETCEYRRHFLNFRPRRIVLTSVEPDHQDCFPTYGDILSAFVEYIGLLPAGGVLVFCADDPGASEAARLALARRPDIRRIPYGRKAEGGYRLLDYAAREGSARFRVAAFDRDFELRVPGEHLALDAAAALALAFELWGEARGAATPDAPAVESAAAALAAFRGSKRRSEILGEARGVVFMDDYAHHPTAIKATIRGLRSFWPGRRLVVDFMPHTYSRTKALFAEFASSFDEAELLVLHGIYASAREEAIEGVSGLALRDAIAERRRGAAAAADPLYFEEPLEAKAELGGLLRPGDLFATMGAGDNWKLGEALFRDFRDADGGRS
jgi:UDP-N-acetylmuramate--alanine ligase